MKSIIFTMSPKVKDFFQFYVTAFNNEVTGLMDEGRAVDIIYLNFNQGWLESSSAEKDRGFLVDTKLDMRLQCALAAKKANSLLSCMSLSAASRSREVILPVLALVRPHLKCWVQCWARQYERGMDIME
ncbi:hypothetical protein QYF61_021172 [Mycteria americana]|uniref:Uncharacterized protein n=1 Tax=Mycteria americana TaxID=33587 RepID=A0AAN7S9X7_MYCAM|nr:hypothetical protein QYF61_021172 [Mycteria americana]